MKVAFRRYFAIAFVFGVAPAFHAIDRSLPTLAKQPITEYAKRREALRATLTNGFVVLKGATDADWPGLLRFRQFNDFMYLTGVDTPGAYLVVLPSPTEEGIKEALFLPNQTVFAAAFDGLKVSPGAAAQTATGIGSVRNVSQLDDFLRSALQKHSKVYVGRMGESASDVRTKLRELSDSVEFEPITRTTSKLRAVKSEPEIVLLKAAIASTTDAHRAAARRIRPGVMEHAVEGVVQEAFRRHGSERDAFQSIIGSGPNSCIPHYFLTTRKIEARETVVVDIGAEYAYYCADVTRTYPTSGRFTSRQRELYQAVLNAQKAAERAAKLGATMEQLDAVARESLKNSGLTAKSSAGKPQTLDHFFIHGLGHYLGMDVHDVGPGGPLTEGMCFTIEPGVYITSENIGIRIEDDYLMTAKGLVKLTTGLPSDPDQVERLMRGR